MLMILDQKPEADPGLSPPHLTASINQVFNETSIKNYHVSSRHENRMSEC
jgi:hypothetical protein